MEDGEALCGDWVGGSVHERRVADAVPEGEGPEPAEPRLRAQSQPRKGTGLAWPGRSIALKGEIGPRVCGFGYVELQWGGLAALGTSRKPLKWGRISEMLPANLRALRGEQHGFLTTKEPQTPLRGGAAGVSDHYGRWRRWKKTH